MSQTPPQDRLYVLQLQQRSQALASRVLAFRGDAEAVAQAHDILTNLPQGADGAPVAIGVGRAMGEAVQWLGVWALNRGVVRWRVSRRAA
jgi:hypothetical protein